MKNVLSKSMDSEIRSIWVENGLIIYKRKRDGLEDYFTYNDALYEIFQLDDLVPFRHNSGRLKFKICREGLNRKFYAYDLAYACYNEKVEADNFLEGFQRYLGEKSMQELSIDHADNNVCNNTALNLSLMNIRLNTVKSDIVAHIKEPVYLNSIYYGGKYRVQMESYFGHSFERSAGGTYVLRPHYSKQQFICDNAEEDVKCLKWLTEQQSEWVTKLKDNSGHWIKNDNECWCADIVNSLRAQRLLADMPIERFTSFPLEKSITMVFSIT